MSVLKIKDGNSWVNIPTSGVGVPQGGNAGEVLTKASSTDYDAGWVTPYHVEVRTVSVTIPSNNRTTSVTATVPSGYTFICWLTPGPVGWGDAIWYSSSTILEPSTSIWTTNNSSSARQVVCPYLIAYTG